MQPNKYNKIENHKSISKHDETKVIDETKLYITFTYNGSITYELKNSLAIQT